MNKILSLVLAAVMLLTLVSAAAPVTRAEAFDAAAVIEGFTTVPEKVSATFTQTYVLDVQNDDYQAFAKDVADVVTVDLDLTPGNVYYYGKLVEKDGTVTEQLVCAEDGTYYCSATGAEKTAIGDEAAAVAAISEMMNTLSRKTAGYIDPGFFTFNNNSWMTAYILLGSTNVAPDDFWFNYSYTDNNGGINAEITADYIGYYGDSGTFEFAKQADAAHAAVISLSTTPEGYITNFTEELTSFQSLAIISPPVPLVLNGERTLTAVYGQDVERIASLGGEEAAPAVEPTEPPAAEPVAAPEEAATIVLGDVEGCSVVTYDFDYATFAFVEGTSVAPGHFVAFQVAADEGAEIAASVNGEEVSFINGYYCYMTAAEAGKEYVVSASAAAAEAPAEEAADAVIVLGDVENCSVVTYDFDYATFAFVEGTSVAPGHFVAFQVAADEGAEIAASVNGEEVAFINGYYCYMTAAEAGKEYVVAACAAAAEEAPAEEPADAVIVLGNVEGGSVVTYDFDYATFAFVEGTSVAPGHYVAFQFASDEGADVAIDVNGEEVNFINGYYCYMTPAEAGKEYVITISVVGPAPEEMPDLIPVRVFQKKNAVIEVFDFVQGDYSTLAEPTTAVSVGNFLAVKVTPAAGYTLESVRVNNKVVDASMCFNGYWCVPVTEDVESFIVNVILK